MRKFILFFLIILSFNSCSFNDSKINIETTKMGKLIDSLTLVNPDFKNNEVTIENFNKDFKKITFERLKKENDFFEDMDFKFEGVNKFNEGYLINLSKYSSYNVNDSIFYIGNFNAICLTNDEKIISTLKQDSLYRFKAQFKGEINKFPYLQNSINGSLYTPFIGYSNHNYDLGVLIFSLDTIYNSKTISE